MKGYFLSVGEDESKIVANKWYHPLTCLYGSAPGTAREDFLI